MKKVFICSPYRGHNRAEQKKNIQLAKRACKLALRECCVPYAPHLYFTGFLSDSDQQQRELGIMLGLMWLAECDEIWVIGNRITEGMQCEIDKAEELSISIVRKDYR